MVSKKILVRSIALKLKLGVTLEHDNKFIRSLVHNSQSGNKSAFEQLFNITYDRVYAVALRLLVQPDIAEKITTEVFYKAWLELRAFREDCPIQMWLSAITVYVVLDELRRGKMRRLLFLQDRHANDKELTLVHPIYKNDLESAIANLHFLERIILVLHDMEKYSIDEIAAILEEPVPSVKSRLDKARKELIASDVSISSVSIMLLRVAALPDKIEPKNKLWLEVSQMIQTKEALMTQEREAAFSSRSSLARKDRQAKRRLKKEWRRKEKEIEKKFKKIDFANIENVPRVSPKIRWLKFFIYFILFTAGIAVILYFLYGRFF